MSGNRKVDLYVAKSLAQLNGIADSGIPKAITNARIVVASSQKLFVEGERLYLDGDEEKAYIVYMRYFSLVCMVKKSADYKKDQKYFDSFFGAKNTMVALERAEQLGDSLKKRYEELEAVELSKKLTTLEKMEVKKEQPSSTRNEIVDLPDTQPVIIAPENAVAEVIEKKFIDPHAPAGGVTVQRAFRLMSDANVSVLLMDVRSRDDFTMSHVKSVDCINVPADCLKPGTTVNQIEKSLPLESKVAWKGRSTVDYIILFDWKCSAGQLDERSSLACLRDAFTKWDIETVLRNEPLVLEGGYEEWLLCYPAQTTNCNVTVPVTTVGRTAVPSLESIDYDLGFLDESPKKAEQQVKVNISESSGVRSATAVGSQDNVLADVDNKRSMETSHQEPLSEQQSAVTPWFDRSNKPQHQTSRMNNAVDSTSVRVVGDISRLSNPLNEGLKSVNEASPAQSVNGPSAVYKSHSSSGLPPVTDRSKKPIDKVKNSNQEVAGQGSKLKDEMRSMELLQEKKAVEAHALADLMRKKKRIEDELSLLTQKRDILSSQELANQKSKLQDELDIVIIQEKKASEAQELADLMRQRRNMAEEVSLLTRTKNLSTLGSVPYDESSSDDDGSTQLRRDGAPPLGANQERATAANLPDVALESELLEDRRRQLEELRRIKEENEKLVEQRLNMEKRRLEAEKTKEEQLTVEQNKLEMQERAKREAEVAEQQKRLEEAKRKQKEETERRKEAEEMERRRQEADEQRQKEEKDRLMEGERKKKEAEMELKKRQIQSEEQRRQEQERERQIKKDEADLSKQNDVDRKLPVNWERRLHPETGKYYYINHITRTTQWNFPIQDPSTISSYKAPLKNDSTPSTSFGGGLTRSHSSPNIAKLVQDADAEQNAPGRPQTTQPLADRSTKPQSSQHIPLQTEVSAAKVRNLQPTWGSVGRGLTGLRNMGNTCYMNSTIQCLSNTAPLTLYFLSNSYISDINRENSDGYRGQVADEYAVLIKALWSGQHRSVVPKDFRSVCCLMNPMFSSSQHQDSQELLMYLMSGLSEGLNKVRQKPSLPPLETDNMEEEQAADAVWNYLHLKENSIFADFFQGLYKSTVMCQHCDKKSVKFDSFMYLTLPIPSPTRCSLADCIQHFSKESKLTGDSRWDCPRCRCKRDATVRLVIWRLPRILLIVLKRFHYEGIWRDKITAHVDFPLEGLNMSRYISGPRTQPPYNLFAVSNHYGMLDGGHYTASCRSPRDGKWYKYDDHEVSEMSSSSIKSSAAYMLFYTSMKFDNMLRV